MWEWVGTRRGWLLALGLGTVVVALTFKPLVENDGIGYFSYLHTLWVDHDFNFEDEYRAALSAHVTLYPALIESRTQIGQLANYFPIGPALFATPAYLAALILAGGGGDQYAPALVDSFALASLLAGLLTLAIAWRLTRSLAVLVGVGLATPFAYYLLYEPSYSHTFSALASSLFILAWWRLRGLSDRWWWWVLMGALGGVMALARWQDGLLLGIIAIDVGRGRWRSLLAIPAALAVFSPQLLADHALFGTWLPQRPAGQSLQVFPGHYLQVLISSYHGLFVWHPITAAAVLGFVFVPGWRLRAAFAYAFLVETAINGALPDWWGGFAFGARRFLDLTPFWAIGLAALSRKLPPLLVRIGLLAAVAWNLLLLANFTYVIKTDHDPGYLGLIRGQITALRFLPHLLTQGAIGRDLLWWPALHLAPHWSAGLWLTGCVVAALAVALFAARHHRAGGDTPLPSGPDRSGAL